MVLYHGSKNKFNKFSFDYKGLNGSSEGDGIYLTTSRKIAYENYASTDGYLYTVKLNEGKELSSEKITLSRNDIKTIIEKLGAYDVLNDYQDVDYYGIDYVMNYAINTLLSNENDNDIITDLCYTCGDEKVLNVISSLGYTHTKNKAKWGNDKEPHTIYVVYDLNALQIINVE